MQGTQVQFTVELAMETCCNCGMVFAITTDYQQQRRRDHQTFYCPAGHGQHYGGKSDVEKAREDAARYKRLWDEAAREAADERKLRGQAEHQARAHKAAHTRTKNRIRNGVCPCCNRHFENLARHMHTKHPEYETQP